MSTKKIKKFGNLKIPAQSLYPPDKDGYLTKQGGSIKTWKRRYFILKGRTLYYYKTPKDQELTGKLDLEPSSLVKEEPGKKKPNLFSITTAKRIFFMFPDTAEEVKPWVEAVSKGIEVAKAGPPIVSITSSAPPSHSSEVIKSKPSETSTDVSPLVRLNLAKEVIKFLKDESKVLEFWRIWTESIPSKEDLASGMSIDFHVATSADMQKVTWRVGGPQNIFIQKMVDFFWNVGAPESEIDRLNDVGALINPVKIGSWIDMSGKGGMDGGWYFPVDVPLKLAIEASDPGDAIQRFASWADLNKVTSVYAVGRDMGAAPPRQTELRVRLPGNDGRNQIKLALDAWRSFEIPAIPDEALKILHEMNETGVCLSIITSSEGFVRVGILVPRPSTQHVLALCDVVMGNKDELASFEGSLRSEGPQFVEFQHLMKGFGYGVYKEGFDVVFHYKISEEIAD